jgi:hypothetical protein
MFATCATSGSQTAEPCGNTDTYTQGKAIGQSVISQITSVRLVIGTSLQKGTLRITTASTLELNLTIVTSVKGNSEPEGLSFIITSRNVRCVRKLLHTIDDIKLQQQIYFQRGNQDPKVKIIFTLIGKAQITQVYLII